MKTPYPSSARRGSLVPPKWGTTSRSSSARLKWTVGVFTVAIVQLTVGILGVACVAQAADEGLRGIPTYHRGNGNRESGANTPVQEERSLHAYLNCMLKPRPGARVGRNGPCPTGQMCERVPDSRIHPSRRRRGPNRIRGTCVDVPAPATFDLEVSVVDPDDNGVPNAPVRLVPSGGDVISKTTDAAGIVSFEGVPQGDFAVEVEDECGETETFPGDADSTASGDVSIDVVLTPRTYELIVSAVDSNGDPVANAFIQITASYGYQSSELSSDGTSSFAGIRLGDFGVVVTDDMCNLATFDGEADCATGESKSISITLG